jgi:hypothetical protein
MYNVLPKVFVDGYTYVKIAVTNDYVNCTNYESRSGMTFEGCMIYQNGELKETRGIYYVKANPIFSFGSRRKITRSLDELKEIIKENIAQNAKYLELNDLNKLLVTYDNYGIDFYDKFIKGRVLKFPLKGEQGHLKIIWVPKLGVKLPYEKVTHLEVYNHTVDFEKEVVKFNDINVFGGVAELVYNQNDDVVLAKVSSPDHGEETVTLGIHELYIIAHPRPRVVSD